MTGLTRKIALSLDPSSLQDFTLNLDKVSGTVSFTLTELPNYSIKDIINIQGLDCQVERIGPLVAHGSSGFKVECRIRPTLTQEFISVNFADQEDGTGYSMHDVVGKMAAQAGTTVTIGVPDVNVVSFSYSGRIISGLESAADALCGQFLQQNGIWFIADKDFSVGDFTLDSAEDLVSIDQSLHGDILDELASNSSDLKDAYIRADELVDDIEELKEAIDKIEEQLAKENEEDIKDLSMINRRAFLADIGFEFGHKGNAPQQLDSSCIIDGGKWDVWTPKAASNLNPDNPKRKYYQIVELVDTDNRPTGKYKGCYSLFGATILVEVQKPSNTAGLYFMRGTASNISEAVNASTWTLVKTVERVTTKTVNGFIENETRLYLAFSVSLPKGYVAIDEVTQDVGPAVKDQQLYRLNVTVEYAVANVQPWQFIGEISLTYWPLVKDNQCVGYVHPNSSVYSINGDLLYEAENSGQLLGPVQDGANCILDNGKLVGLVSYKSVKDLELNHTGLIDGVLVKGGSSKGPIVGFIRGDYEYKHWPGFDHDKDLEDAFDDSDPEHEPITICLLNKLPSVEGIDYSDFDPSNPDAWIVPDLSDDPFDEEAQLNKELDDSKDRLASLELEAEVTANKIACLEKALTAYSAESSLVGIRNAALAWTTHRREQDRQHEFNIVNKSKLKELFDKAVVLDVSHFAELSNVGTRLLVTNCVFIYNSVLPLPFNTFSIPEISARYSGDCGIIQSVSMTASGSSCSVSVTALLKLKE